MVARGAITYDRFHQSGSIEVTWIYENDFMLVPFGETNRSG